MVRMCYAKAKALGYYMGRTAGSCTRCDGISRVSTKPKHWVTICVEPLALLRGVRKSRRDGIYGNNGF
jgi:hypothetical protein